MNYNREAEIARYVECYKDPAYAMGLGRKAKAREVLASLPRGKLLDVGAGRGELKAIAEALGFFYLGLDPATGVDIEYTDWEAHKHKWEQFEANNLVMRATATETGVNDKSYDVVVCLDVLEHLIPEDVEPALREMDRVSRGLLFLTAADTPSFHNDGSDLHISARPVAEWEALFAKVFTGRKIERLGDCSPSPGWLIYPSG